MLAVAALLGTGAWVAAFPPTPLNVVNPGFEANTVAPNCFSAFVPSGWTLFDPNGIHDGALDAVGGLHPLPGGPFFLDGAPEGENVALVFLQGDIGGGPVGLSQVLPDVLEIETTYTLSARVGNIASGQGPPPCDVFGFFDLDGFPGYRVQLLAGGVVIAEDNNTLAGNIDEGAWGQSTVEVSIGDSHPQQGQPLEIRLINLNVIDTPMDPGIEVDFDDVRLVQGCSADGDLDADADVDLEDAELFVSVLLDLDMDPLHADRADLDCSGSADAADLQPFISALVN